jgi:hypothetical protein
LRRILEVSQAYAGLWRELQGRAPLEAELLMAYYHTQWPSPNLPWNGLVWKTVREGDRPSVGYAWLELAEGRLVAGPEHWDSGD